MCPANRVWAQPVDRAYVFSEIQKCADGEKQELNLYYRVIHKKNGGLSDARNAFGALMAQVNDELQTVLNPASEDEEDGCPSGGCEGCHGCSVR